MTDQLDDQKRRILGLAKEIVWSYDRYSTVLSYGVVYHADGFSHLRLSINHTVRQWTEKRLSKILSYGAVYFLSILKNYCIVFSTIMAIMRVQGLGY